MFSLHVVKAAHQNCLLLYLMNVRMWIHLESPIVRKKYHTKIYHFFTFERFGEFIVWAKKEYPNTRKQLRHICDSNLQYNQGS